MSIPYTSANTWKSVSRYGDKIVVNYSKKPPRRGGDSEEFTVVYPC